jgi:macrolide transport system ATP-binding/permease protein
MRFLARVRSSLTWMIQRRKRESEMETEVRFHILSYADDLIESGVHAEEANRRARVEFGGVETHKDAMRTAIGLRWLDDLWSDLGFALRILRRNPGFTLIAVLSLGIGIGVNSTLFSLADALVLRPLSVARPEQVVTLLGKSPSESAGAVSYRDYADFRDQSRSFDGLVAYTIGFFGFTAKKGDLPQVQTGMLVSGNLFQAMGVEPELGRGFRPEEDQVPGRDAVVVLGHDFWEKQLGADRSIVGRTVVLNGIDFTVIGVAPQRFTGIDHYLRPTMFVPLMMFERLAANPDWKMLEHRDDRELDVKGRLKPGVSLAEAQTELATIAASLQRAYPETNRNQSVALMTETQQRVLRNPSNTALVTMLMALAALVLLVACANLANLLLGRARARTREIATRLAIGAGRLRLIRQLLAESLAIALAGGVASLLFATAGTAFLARIQIPTDLPVVISIKVDERALLFSLAVSLLSAVLFGLVPAVQASRANLVVGLKASDAENGRRRSLWGRSALVISQVALSLVLMIVAAMLYRGLHSKLAIGPGFRTDHLIMMSFDPEVAHYKDPQTKQFYEQLIDRARSLPGIKSVALTEVIPMAPAQHQQNIVPEGDALPKDHANLTVFADIVGNGFFDTMAIPILDGRGFNSSDTASAPKVAVVNEVLARHCWPNQNAIGKRLRLNDDKSREIEIVGVARASSYIRLGEGPTEYLYLPLSQNMHARLTLVVQSIGDAASLAPELRETVRTLDPNQPVYDVRTMSDFYRQGAVSIPNLINQVVGAMGLIGLALALVGLYGLMSFSVARRTREIGIRMAIGANRATVVRMILRQGLALVVTGLAIGLLASFVAEKGLSALFTSTTRDPVAYLIVAPAFLAVAMLAAWVPARRAARVDPTTTLRYE